MSDKKKSAVPADARTKSAGHGWTVHPLTLFLFATIATIAAGFWLWRENEPELLDTAAFQLTWDKLDSTPSPAYLQTDLKKAAFDGSHLAELNLLDHDIVKKVHAAFAVQSWVDQAAVRKNRRGISVALTYRKPVALVEFGNNLLLPVDRAGIVLDGEPFNAQDTSSYLRVTVEAPQVGSMVNGETWPDQRVVAAATIADKICGCTTKWGIVRIVHVPIVRGSIAAEGDFALLTAEGAAGIRIMWGSPVGFERPNEASADQKIAVLDQWIAERGPLNELGTSQTIDVRDGSIQLLAE